MITSGIPHYGFDTILSHCPGNSFFMLGSDGEYSKTNFLYSTMILCGFDYFLKLLDIFSCLLCLKYDGYSMSDIGVDFPPYTHLGGGDVNL